MMQVIYNTFFIAAYLLIIGSCCCSSCRTVNKSVSTSDSIAVKVEKESSSTTADMQLQELIRRWNRNYRFQKHEITLKKDTNGYLEERHTIYDLQLIESEENDSTAQNEKLNVRTSKRDSTAAEVKNDSLTVEKKPPKRIRLVGFMIIISLCLVIYKVRKSKRNIF